MKIGKCPKCGNVGPITPVLNPKDLCSKCWLAEHEKTKNEKEGVANNLYSKCG